MNCAHVSVTRNYGGPRVFTRNSLVDGVSQRVRVVSWSPAIRLFSAVGNGSRAGPWPAWGFGKNVYSEHETSYNQRGRRSK